MRDQDQDQEFRCPTPIAGLLDTCCQHSLTMSFYFSNSLINPPSTLFHNVPGATVNSIHSCPPDVCSSQCENFC
jgi:hypothetical protein